MATILCQIAASAAVLSISTSCSPPGSSSEGVTIRVGAIEGLNHAVPFFVAKRLGYFKDAGLNVEMAITTPGAPMNAALRAGDLDIAMSSTAQFMTSIAQGVLRGKIISENSDKTYLMLAKKEITSPHQLRGKVFAISGPNSGDQIWAQAVLAQYGIKPNEVHWISVGNPGTRFAALTKDAVDATEMNAGSLPEKAKGYVLLDVDESPVPWIANGVFANQKMIESNKPALQKFVAAMGRGAERARSDPKLAMVACQDSGSTQATCTDVLRFFLGSKNPYNWSSTGRVNRAAIEAMLPNILATVPNAKITKLEDFVDFTIAGEAPLPAPAK